MREHHHRRAEAGLTACVPEFVSKHNEFPRTSKNNVFGVLIW
jgi:hypothetical protein